MKVFGQYLVITGGLLFIFSLLFTFVIDCMKVQVPMHLRIVGLVAGISIFAIGKLLDIISENRN